MPEQTWITVHSVHLEGSTCTQCGLRLLQKQGELLGTQSLLKVLSKLLQVLDQGCCLQMMELRFFSDERCGPQIGVCQ